MTSLSGGRETESTNIDSIEEELNRAKTRLEAQNISCETLILVRHKTPGEDIVCFAEENSVDEIILQIKKTSKVGKLIRGSTAQHVILNAHCTVVSVR